MHWAWQWSVVFFVVALLDVAVRLGTGFDMVWIVRADALLFLGASLTLLRLQRVRPALAGWQRALQGALMAALALGGLRATLWALGLPLQRANAMVLAAAVIGGAGMLWWRRHHARAAA